MDTMRELAPQWLRGCTLRACWFEPTFHKHAGHLCAGMQIHVEDPLYYQHEAFRPWRLTALAAPAARLYWYGWQDIPRTVVGGYLKVARAPIDATLKLAGRGKRGEVVVDGCRVVHVVTADSAAACCPGCGAVSTSVKANVIARPKDLPYGEGRLAVVWHKRRWRCRRAGCARESFTEQIAEVPAGARTSSTTGSSRG